MISFRRIPVCVVLFFLAAVFHADAEPLVVTAPQGFITWTLPANATKLFSVPLSDTPKSLGQITSFTGNTLTVAGTPWAPGQFAGTPHMVHLLSGAQEGRWLRLVSNTSNTLTAESGDRAFTHAGFAVTLGDRFEILQGDTLGTLFGETDADLVLQGGATAAQADVVALFVNQQWIEYFFRTGLGWRRVDQPNVAPPLPVLFPESPIRITRRGPTTNLILTGRVPLTRALLPVTASNTPLGWPFPINSPLSSLSVGGPDLWKKASVSTSADRIAMPDNGGTFFQGTTGTWMAAPGSPVTTTTNVKFQGGGGFYVAKMGGATGLHSVELPYDPSGPSIPSPTPEPEPEPPTPTPRPVTSLRTLPPSIRVTSRRSYRTEAERVTIRGTSTPHGQPVSRVQFKSGGKFRNVSGISRWKARVRLKEGRNVFRFRAVDNLGRSSSLVRVTITRTR